MISVVEYGEKWKIATHDGVAPRWIFDAPKPARS
jgi:hypothetical protein